ncbi:MAG: DNA polymerase-1 [Verrucomicrobiales bacterium]|jgi:DNA polymerase-1
MAKRLFLLDGMALIYRAHFALIRTPIFTTRGFNTSAILGFTNTLLEILEKRKPTHIAVVFDTSAPTARHEVYPEYKANRDAMPEELSAALPHVKRVVEAFNIPVITLDGYEADDIIGTLAKSADAVGDIETFMVTPDKDFAQLVSATTKMHKPGRQGNEVEILGVEEITTNWQIERPEQVIDILGLWGDASDNIPGVPGIGEKTAKKLIAQFGSIEQLLENTDKLKGKQKENVVNNAEQALLSKQLATIITDVPVSVTIDELELKERNDEALQSLFVQFELNAVGKRLWGKEFQAGRGHVKVLGKGDEVEDVVIPDLKTMDDVEAVYEMVDTAEGRAKLAAELGKQKSVCFDTETSGLDSKTAQLAGLAFSWEAKRGFYAPIKKSADLDVFREVLGDPKIEKIGHNLKYDLSVLLWHGVEVRGLMFDTMLAHTLISPEQRHTMDFISEALLGYSPISITSLIGEKDQEGGQLDMLEVMERKPEDVARYAAEDADVTWQLAEKLRPMLKEEGQERVFYEVEAPLISVLATIEQEGIRIDVDALGEISVQLGEQMAVLEKKIYAAADGPFNLNSPKQLGEILVEKLKLIEKPKKTKTGQYKMDEQVLSGLAMHNEIAADILGYREATKLKSTYVDALPLSVLKKSGRVHTQFDQLMTATGRLASNNPNLQNIPVRTEQGREIRKAFVPREGFKLFSADYSQVELRVMASLSGDPAMMEAFEQGQDIHTATAARVYGVGLDEVLREMRSAAKMVNFGIIYGITAFGLSQRLGIPRGEANEIIEQYFRQYPGVKQFMDDTVEFAKEHGFVETMTGRRRKLRDINSRNWSLRNAAERTAINTPVQGSAADMIKLAMIGVQQQLLDRGAKTRMLLQVHDELVFDLCQDEEAEVVPLVIETMKTALPLKVPIVVDSGIGANWLEAH